MFVMYFDCIHSFTLCYLPVYLEVIVVAPYVLNLPEVQNRLQITNKKKMTFKLFRMETKIWEDSVTWKKKITPILTGELAQT